MPDKVVFCSFCGKSDLKRRIIIENPRKTAGICEVCISTCINLVAKELKSSRDDLISESVDIDFDEEQAISPEEKEKQKKEILDLFDGFEEKKDG